MKALSIRQPWAWLIVNGLKDVENRTWKTDFRGRFLVHAGYIFDESGYLYVCREMRIRLPGPDEMERGGIVGTADIMDCVKAHASPWFVGPYGFVLENASVLPFHAMPGRQGLFDVRMPPDMLAPPG